MTGDSPYYSQDYQAWRGLGESNLHRYSNGKQKVENLYESVNEDKLQQNLKSPHLLATEIYFFRAKVLWR